MTFLCLTAEDAFCNTAGPCEELCFSSFIATLSVCIASIRKVKWRFLREIHHTLHSYTAAYLELLLPHQFEQGCYTGQLCWFTGGWDELLKLTSSFVNARFSTQKRAEWSYFALRSPLRFPLKMSGIPLRTVSLNRWHSADLIPYHLLVQKFMWRGCLCTEHYSSAQSALSLPQCAIRASLEAWL